MSQTTPKIIGAIGGMGPLSSIQFYTFVIDYCQNELHLSLNKDYPHLLISNLPVPDLINSKNDSDVSKEMIKAEVQKLKAAGVGALALVCNTMHLYFDEFQNSTDIPFINMLDEVANDLLRRRKKKVLIVATPTTLKERLYNNALEAKNIQTINPLETSIAQLGEIIKLIVAGKAGAVERQQVLSIIDQSLEPDVDEIVFGCTELGILVDQADTKLGITNSIQVLARSVTDVALGRRPI